MKILLTHAYFLCEDRKEQTIMRPYPPLGILYLSSYLEERGVDHDVIDTTFLTKKDLFDRISEIRPGLVGIYVNLMTKINAIAIMRHIRQALPGSLIVLGGPEIRHNAENFLRLGADVAVIGEGEETFHELALRFSTRASDRGLQDLSGVRGIALLDSGGFVVNQERDRIPDLDTLPVPNRKRINLHHYLSAWKTRHGVSAVSVSTMRGCPYTCKWCSRAVYGLSYRRRSPALVIEEIQDLMDTYNPDSFWFVDDVFTISHKWLQAFAQEIRKRGLRFRYECITRSDRMNDLVLRLLKESGCFRVWIGAESGSQRVIDLMDRRLDVGQVREMIRLTRQYGIEAGTFIMLGYPGETLEDIEDTVRHLRKAKPDQCTVTLAYPIRGTQMHQEVKDSIPETSWESASDRDLRFRRTYSDLFYRQAVRRVGCEVALLRPSGTLQYLRLKSLSIASAAAMRLLAAL